MTKEELLYWEALKLLVGDGGYGQQYVDGNGRNGSPFHEGRPEERAETKLEFFSRCASDASRMVAILKDKYPKVFQESTDNLVDKNEAISYNRYASF